MSNLDIFRANGFHFDVNDEEPPGRKLRLVALPFSKNTQFGEEGGCCLCAWLLSSSLSVLLSAPAACLHWPKSRAQHPMRWWQSGACVCPFLHCVMA